MRMGRAVAQTVAKRLGRSLLELGGNNAMIVTPSADLELAIRAIIFAAAGTCGQRCTTLRRLIVHRIDSPTSDRPARRRSTRNLQDRQPAGRGRARRPADRRTGLRRDGSTLWTPAESQGGKSFTAANASPRTSPPAASTSARRSSRSAADAPIVQRRNLRADPLRHGLRNARRGDRDPQRRAAGTCRPRSSPATCARPSISSRPPASDCGIANVNIGTSGAEIGGAFGGEKDTGGGRESGSDAWKAYMRRATNTINYSRDLPLAQGINFDL